MYYQYVARCCNKDLIHNILDNVVILLEKAKLTVYLPSL